MSSLHRDVQWAIFTFTHAYTFCLYTLIKVVSYYDLSVLSMSVMGFKKKVWMGGGWVRSIQVFLEIFLIFLILQSPLGYNQSCKYIMQVNGIKHFHAGR